MTGPNLTGRTSTVGSTETVSWWPRSVPDPSRLILCRSHSNIIPTKSHLLRLYIPRKLTKEPTSVEIPSFNDWVKGANPARIPSMTLPGSVPPCSIFHSSAFAWLTRTSALIAMKPTNPQRAITTAILILRDIDDVNRLQKRVLSSVVTLLTQIRYPDLN